MQLLRRLSKVRQELLEVNHTNEKKATLSKLVSEGTIYKTNKQHHTRLIMQNIQKKLVYSLQIKGFNVESLLTLIYDEVSYCLLYQVQYVHRLSK